MSGNSAKKLLEILIAASHFHLELNCCKTRSKLLCEKMSLIPKKEKIDPDEDMVDVREAATGSLIPKKEKIDPNEEMVDEREAATGSLIPKKENIDPNEEKVDEREAATGSLIPKKENIDPEEEKVGEPAPATARNRKRAHSSPLPDRKPGKKPSAAQSSHDKGDNDTGLANSFSRTVGLRGTAQLVPASNTWDEPPDARLALNNRESRRAAPISDNASPATASEMTEYFLSLSPILVRGRIDRAKFYWLRHQINRFVLVLLNSKPLHFQFWEQTTPRQS